MTHIGLIGCGGMGDVHRTAIQQLQNRARFSAAVDLDIQRARDTADVLACDTAVSDYRQVFDQIDAAIIALPHHFHHPIGMDLLRHSKHLLMDSL